MLGSSYFNKSTQFDPAAFTHKEVINLLGFDPIPERLSDFIESAKYRVQSEFSEATGYAKDLMGKSITRDPMDLPRKASVQTSFGENFELNFEGTQRLPILRKDEVFFAIHRDMTKKNMVHLEVGVAERNGASLKDARHLTSVFLDYSDRNNIKITAHSSVEEDKRFWTGPEDRKNAVFAHLMAVGKVITLIKLNDGVDEESLKRTIRPTLALTN